MPPKINETHLCILKSLVPQKHVSVEFLELNFPFSDALDELRLMSENPNRHVVELEEYVQNCSLACLLEGFDYCKDLNSSFKEYTPYTLTNKEEYFSKIAALTKSIEISDNAECEYKNELKEAFKHRKRKKAFKDFHDRSIAYSLNLAYEQCKTSPQILAFSHSYRGYSFPAFKLGRDFDIIFKTNFGYGSSSYFFTNIKYKGVAILPYSDWIKYRTANVSEILRYTRKHPLKNEAWFNTMSFVAEAYNLSITNPQKFTNEWIISECEEMVSGLERLLNCNKEILIIDNHHVGNKKIKLSGYDLIKFKGERISGALSFLESIKVLSTFNSQIDSYINRLIKLNSQILIPLKKYIIVLTKAIAENNRKRQELLPELFRMEKKLKPINELKHKIEVQIKIEKPEISVSELNEIISSELFLAYPKYKSIIESFEQINMKYKVILDLLKEQKNYKISFESYILTIKTYFLQNSQTTELIT